MIVKKVYIIVIIILSTNLFVDKIICLSSYNLYIFMK
jgi:hypothetical protein